MFWPCRPVKGEAVAFSLAWHLPDLARDKWLFLCQISSKGPFSAAALEVQRERGPGHFPQEGDVCASLCLAASEGTFGRRTLT